MFDFFEKAQQAFKPVASEAKKITTQLSHTVNDTAQQVTDTASQAFQGAHSDKDKLVAIFNEYQGRIETIATRAREHGHPLPLENNNNQFPTPLGLIASELGFKSVSFGLGLNLAVPTLGVGAEAGSVFESNDLKDGKPATCGYIGKEWSVGLQVGGAACVPVGFWKEEPRKIGGNYTALGFDLHSIRGASVTIFADAPVTHFDGFVIAGGLGISIELAAAHFGNTEITDFIPNMI